MQWTTLMQPLLVTICTSSRRFERNAVAHQSGVTINHALTSVIGWHSSLLQIPVHSCFSCRRTIPTTDWCTYTGSCTTTQDWPSLQPTHTMRKPVSMIWHRYQIFGNILWWNKSNRNFGTAIHHMSPSKWPILQNWHTTSATHQPTIMHTAVYTKNKAGIEHQCSLQIRNTYSATIPTPITSNLWILTSAIELDPAEITLICPDQAPKSISIWKPIHVLHLPPACSATSHHFHLPPLLRIIRWWSKFHSIWLI